MSNNDDNESGDRVRGAASSEHAEPESPLNNIDSGKYQIEDSPPDGFLPLRYGIDSLILSYRGYMTDHARERLAKLKAFAQDRDTIHLAQAQVAGHIFKVSDKGRGRYKYLLLGSCFEIQLCDAENPSVPVAYVKVLSQFLATKQPVEAEAEVLLVLEQLCYEMQRDETVSRADLYLDFCYSDSVIQNLVPNQFVTRAEVIRPYITDQIATGWDFGLGSALSARIYNKTLEITKSKREYLKFLWKEEGWVDETVWRLEFQLRRSVLDSFMVETVAQLMSKRGELWSYLTLDWLRLALPHPTDSNRSRWPTHPLWMGVWDGACGSLNWPMRKVVVKDDAPELETVLHNLCSPLSSLFALKDLAELKEAERWISENLFPALERNFSPKGIRLSQYLYDQIKNKIRLFNLKLNDGRRGNPGKFGK